LFAYLLSLEVFLKQLMTSLCVDLRACVRSCACVTNNKNRQPCSNLTHITQNGWPADVDVLALNGRSSVKN